MNTPVPHCIFCRANQDVDTPATYLAAQSTDQGKTITWVTICAEHADGWNDGSDWQAPLYMLIEYDEQAMREAGVILERLDREVPKLHERVDAMLRRWRG